MVKDGLRLNITIDSRAMNFFQREAPQKLNEARKRAVEAAGMVWIVLLARVCNCSRQTSLGGVL
ncbi:hypothetical protein ACSU64_28000 [Bacillaceae bacterium C204]|uniref:hypothetical protein n=1 Tax=Neobacillus sp. 204 TaxID=3383351 RepID=UPI00397C3EA5